jgi:hypothetical protein
VGDVVLAGQSVHGCDSTVHVSLSFYPPAIRFITDTLFVGDTLMVGDSAFTMANPSGTVLLSNASYTGCDSTVFVDLKFVTGLNRQPFASGAFELFPNPVAAGNAVSLKCDMVAGARLHIACYDFAGTLIWEKTNVSTENRSILALPVPEIAGVYWLTLKDREGRYANFRLVVF